MILTAMIIGLGIFFGFLFIGVFIIVTSTLQSIFDYKKFEDCWPKTWDEVTKYI